MNEILHIASRREWDAAQASGEYTDPIYREHGILHGCRPAQLDLVTRLHFQGQRDLLVLSLDADRLSAEIRWVSYQAIEGSFPHMLGPILVKEVLAVRTHEVAVCAGGCRCGALGFTVAHPFGPVVNCHCSFCRRVHGAAFTTVAFAPRASVAWTGDGQGVSIYTTPHGNRRHFCGSCASPLFNVGAGGALAAVVVSSLDDELQPVPWAHVNVESKAPWYEISDGLPEFSSWPAAPELEALAQAQANAWLPEQLLLR